MKIPAVVLGILMTFTIVLAQRPSDPALLIPQNAPELDYVSVTDPFAFPAGKSFAGAPARIPSKSAG